MNDTTSSTPVHTAALLVPGSAGEIETLLASPRAPAATPGFAVICHPHPLMGGAMTNKVAYTLASAALKAGLHALRFNFRGVGKSAGMHDEGRGETDDVIALCHWMRERYPGARLMLAGFSFGAFVSLQAAAHAKPDLLISIAPPFGKKYAADVPPPRRPECPWLVVHGLDDEVVSYAETVAVLKKYSPPPELVTLDGVGHFFHGRLTDVSEAVGSFIQKNWA